MARLEGGVAAGKDVPWQGVELLCERRPAHRLLDQETPSLVGCPTKRCGTAFIHGVAHHYGARRM